ncbi:MAG: class I SAM-dependent rRNA methyltransferase [Bacteroidales bacterium]|nr:class I SAM-dependent rRNA methyltransferase [Bacteroidales bacterium]MBN2750794.1 class I SAM-dependent rRNA methyltransferase [Bacteroidales bacterium]
MAYSKIILKPGKEQSVQRFHPWIFSGAINEAVGNPEEGDVVEVTDSNGNFLGLGHCQPGSISVRIFSFQNVEPNLQFWEQKIASAYLLRSTVGLTSHPTTNIYRLIHGEGDGMPGLIVDIYGDTAVMQAHSLGMYLIRETLAKALVNALGGAIKNVYDKSSGTLPFKSIEEKKDEYIIGSLSCDELYEYGSRFLVSWEEGQKTGFFIDQRENRKLLGEYSKGKTVLNTFGYTGGFSVAALKAGAQKVVSVDSSAKAIELTNANVALNFGDNTPHESHCSDVFDFFRNTTENYDIIVLDPPAFAKHNNALHNALQAYKRLNAAAIKRLKPGGLLFTFSCSQVVTKENFRNAVFSGAAITKRQVKIIHQLTQPADHPINIYHPEGEYLKGLVLQVE